MCVVSSAPFLPFLSFFPLLLLFKMGAIYSPDIFGARLWRRPLDPKLHAPGSGDQAREESSLAHNGELMESIFGLTRAYFGLDEDTSPLF